MPGYPGAGLYKQGTELGELVSLGLSDAGSIPAASTIFPPFTPRPARRPERVGVQVFFLLHHPDTLADIQPRFDSTADKIINLEQRERREQGEAGDINFHG